MSTTAHGKPEYPTCRQRTTPGWPRAWQVVAIDLATPTSQDTCHAVTEYLTANGRTNYVWLNITLPRMSARHRRP